MASSQICNDVSFVTIYFRILWKCKRSVTYAMTKLIDFVLSILLCLICFQILNFGRYTSAWEKLHIYLKTKWIDYNRLSYIEEKMINTTECSWKLRKCLSEIKEQLMIFQTSSIFLKCLRFSIFLSIFFLVTNICYSRFFFAKQNLIFKETSETNELMFL